MSTCISRHGEYSEHDPGDWCPRCGALNEEGIVAERDALAAAMQRVRELRERTLTVKNAESRRWAHLIGLAFDGTEEVSADADA